MLESVGTVVDRRDRWWLIGLTVWSVFLWPVAQRFAGDGATVVARKPVVADERQGNKQRELAGENEEPELDGAAEPVDSVDDAAGSIFAYRQRPNPYVIPEGVTVPDAILEAARNMGTWVRHDDGFLEFVSTAQVKTFAAGNGWWVVTPNRIGWHDNSPIVNAAGETLYPVGRALVLEAMVKAHRAELAE